MVFLFVITRLLTMVFGYLYPAYECYKSLEHGRPSMEQLRFWCRFWTILAMLAVAERLGDPLVSWLPFYCEAKLAFMVYLWHPRTQGTDYVYNQLLVPFVSKHEPEIDRHLSEFRTKAGDAAVQYGQSAAKAMREWVMEGLQYLAAHSPRNIHQNLQAPRLQEVDHIPRGSSPQRVRLAQDEDAMWAEQLRGAGRRRVVIQEEDEIDDYDVVERVAEPRKPRNPAVSPKRGGPAATPQGAEAPSDDYASRLRPRSTRRKYAVTPAGGSGGGSWSEEN